LRRINRLLDEIARGPFDGIGKPEQLRHALAGAWSRRIDQESPGAPRESPVATMATGTLFHMNSATVAPRIKKVMLLCAMVVDATAGAR